MMLSSLAFPATTSPTIKSSTTPTSKTPSPISRTTTNLSNTVENLKSTIALETFNLNKIKLLKNKLTFIYSSKAYITLKKGDVSFSMHKGLSIPLNQKFKNAPKAQAKLEGMGIFFTENLKHTKIDKRIIENKLDATVQLKVEAIAAHQRALDAAEKKRPALIHYSPVIRRAHHSDSA